MMPHGFVCDEEIKPHLMKVFEGEYDIPIVARRPLTILDIGANAGAFAVWAGRKFPGATIHCYEPHPETFKFLEQNSRLVAGRVELHNYGIATTTGWLPLYEGESNSGEATIYPGNPTARGTARFVEIKHPSELPVADVLKIDAEGVEPEIIEWLIKDGRKYHAVMFEYHRKDDRRIIDELLKDYILTKAWVGCPSIGTMNYVHRDLMGRHA